METESVKLLAAGLCMAIGSIGSALAEGFVAGKAMESMARNPKIADKLFTNMVVAIALCESTAIYSLVIALIILFAF
ncbi:ATP synthase F0 subunit C [Candidatus Peregrinibacteria bacterium CG10_big_fil_rev_8_21_14_0_10_36_19]|nr:MAG: ATP synthase F0 subunit C [Candidatus Peregrinibacteria bacterium CG10_big_fil_rev_8_21_14_0_10_36_19]